jgi:hypothetical protein
MIPPGILNLADSNSEFETLTLGLSFVYCSFMNLGSVSEPVFIEFKLYESNFMAGITHVYLYFRFLMTIEMLHEVDFFYAMNLTEIEPEFCYQEFDLPCLNNKNNLLGKCHNCLKMN